MLVQGGLHVSQHPLLLARLGPLRDRTTPPREFRRHVHIIAQLLFAQAAADLNLETARVTTPLAECPAHRLQDRIGVIPILRAGLGMVDPILELVPDAQVWHLGLYRDHETLQPVTYYSKLIAPASIDVAYVVDPMLATGGSACAAIALVKRWSVKHIRFLGIIAAPEGVRAVQQEHPDVAIHLGAIDSHLNETSYIVPGLGDAGDRQFGTM